MNIQTLSSSWGDKLLLGLMSVLLVVAAFFAGLLVLAAIAAMALVMGVKLWWVKRQRSADIIDAEYQVLRE